MSRQYENYINHFLEKKLEKNNTSDTTDTSLSNSSDTSDITPPITPPIINLSNISSILNNDTDSSSIKNNNTYNNLHNINKNLNYISKELLIKNIKCKQFKQLNKDSPEHIYNPTYDLLIKNDDKLNNNNNNISFTIENYINTLFNISKNNLKSNVHPDTIKAIVVPYSPLGLKEIGLCCASSYYQLYNRTKPIKKVILLCTNNIDTNNFISTSLTHITSYKNINKCKLPDTHLDTHLDTSSSIHKDTSRVNNTNTNISLDKDKLLKFDNIIIEQLKPNIEINNENIKNEIALINQLPFIETIAPNASIIPILISNKLYLDTTNTDKLNNIIYILKRILKNDDTILICVSNFTNTELSKELNFRKKDIFTNCSIKKQDNSILQFIYDTVSGIKSRSSKIDDILFIQNTPSNSTMTMYIFSQLLNNYSGICKNISSSSSSISSDDSGISVSSNKSNNILYSRITSYYTSIINKNIDLCNFSLSQFTCDITGNASNDTSIHSISYIGLIFTSQPTIENNKIRVIENLFSEYEKIALIIFIKEQLYFHTNTNINLYDTINIYNNYNYNYNHINISKIINAPINTPIFKLNLGLFITLYKNNKLRACIGTSETNNDDYTIENNIKRFILDLSTKETKCRDLLFKPITSDEINDITFNINILYHMKTININTFYSNQFNLGCDGLLFKPSVNDTKQCKYSLTSISKYFNNNINKDIFLNELCKTINISYNNQTNTNLYKLFYNEGILINSY